MSEEEIIERLTNRKKYSLIEIIRKFKREGIENFLITKPELVQGLLDLYNKEKRNHQMTKNNYQGLIADVSTIAETLELEEDATIDEILEKINKEKEKNERLVDRTIKYDKTLEHLQRDTIRKDKIKEQLNELDNMKVDGEVFTTAVNFAKKILQELLEESH